MKGPTVLIIVDAGRSDYISPETMPFVHGLQQQSTTAQFDSPAGFAQEAVIFSGRHPDSSGTFGAFVFDPEHSPFQWVQKLGPLQRLGRPRRFLTPMRWGIKKATQLITRDSHVDPGWIPPRFLPFFRPSDARWDKHESGALGATSVFDMCRSHGKKFRYLAPPMTEDDDDVHRTLVRSLRKGEDVDLYVARFSTAKETGHHEGPFSQAMRGPVLRDLDSRLASIHAVLSTHFGTWNLLICGDHGMGPVEQKVDAAGIIAQADAMPGRDYVLFLHSTIAVLWYLTDKGRKEVEKVLPLIPGSALLDEEDRKRLRIPAGPRWGDRMVAARPGVLYWPDYFHAVDHDIAGMHGYMDRSAESNGMGILASENGRLGTGDLGRHPLVDMFPTLCSLLDVPVPDSNEGTSLVQKIPLVTA